MTPQIGEGCPDAIIERAGKTEGALELHLCAQEVRYARAHLSSACDVCILHQADSTGSSSGGGGPGDRFISLVGKDYMGVVWCDWELIRQ
jgi:hypothetical protein